MKIADSINIYLKTTETCNLDCDHCFTSGSKGAKIYFDVDKTWDFLDRLFSYKKYQSKKVIFHGGEPMLAPPEDIRRIHGLIKDKYPETVMSLQTNLVYNLKGERAKLIDDLFMQDGMGTSWDYNMRFNNWSQQLKWENNVRELVKKGHYLTVMVCLSKSLIENFEPVDIINYIADLGVQHVLFERITSNGNALLNPHIQPQNKDLDAWLLKMYEQTMEYKLYNRIHNMFLDEMATSYVQRQHVGNRCRKCEQSLFTINADGSMSGCPNSAKSEHWGNINLSIEENLASKGRIKVMACEMMRNPNCLTCPVNKLCGGDCHRLPWQGDICAAPKSLMMKMQAEGKTEDYKKLFL